MQIGLLLRSMPHGASPTGPPVSWEELKDLARAAEDAGVDTLFVPDHLIFRHSDTVDLPPGASRGIWEAWTVLSALSQITRRVTLGPFVACTSFRNPALLAKMADALDAVSDGRLILGLGAGWHEPEYTAFGYPFDRRVSRFEEALQIIVPLLRDGRVDFAGQYYQARDCELLPRGPRQSGPPIWIGARMPRMMALAARYADAYNTDVLLDPTDYSGLAERFGVLDGACRAAGRDPASMLRTSGCFLALDGAQAGSAGLPPGHIGGSLEEITAWLIAVKALGVQHATFWLTPWTRRGIEQLAPIVAAAHAL